jgi:hypothetical protein
MLKYYILNVILIYIDDFTNIKFKTPPPNVYEKKGIFEIDIEKHSGWTFGVSRNVKIF